MADGKFLSGLRINVIFRDTEGNPELVIQIQKQSVIESVIFKGLIRVRLRVTSQGLIENDFIIVRTLFRATLGHKDSNRGQHFCRGVNAA